MGLPTRSVSVYTDGDVVMLENQFQSHSQMSQYIPMEAAMLAAMLALPLTLSVGYP